MFFNSDRNPIPRGFSQKNYTRPNPDNVASIAKIPRPIDVKNVKVIFRSRIADHAPLKSLMHRADLVGRLAKYQVAIQAYDIKIEYRAVKHNILRFSQSLSTAHHQRDRSAFVPLS